MLNISLNRTARQGLFALLTFALLLTGTSVAFAGSSEPVRPINLSDSQRARIERGEVLVSLQQNDDVNRGVATGIIQAPMRDVVPLVEECWKYGDWRDNIKDTALISRSSDERVVCAGTAKVPFPARDRDGHFNVHNHTRDLGGVESFVSTFSYIEGSGNLGDMFGYWVLQPYGPNNEHTLMRHVLNVDIGGWLPDFLVRWATRSTLPDMVIGARAYLNKRKSQNLPGPNFWREHSYE
ncbi:hypothetical protein DV096_05640 [Bradymonadaceae bacterium TMQ3]|uniref:START domain-containing protein n=1 Tax=Lujinxingia sediminis TaxID=2480984 RepID=A0ABY0CWE6_9DELT|nr:hypothetical protein [Lujinxingia sediminis]RDV40039.1 hypothetical protein DV096_05640 [Bradymonadaceae bacterium TMQ3]RVU47914.1 hypothetical protein EA187_00310 [Lujinxingia sediminis]TXC77216.1 hypothetical protein FRC91_00305 [Bradymonadales bacterium TMQ1]